MDYFLIIDVLHKFKDAVPGPGSYFSNVEMLKKSSGANLARAGVEQTSRALPSIDLHKKNSTTVVA